MTPTDSIFLCSTFTITNDEFNAFHSMYRLLYSRLIQVLGRDPIESMQLMSMWMWLECQSGQGCNFIHKLLMYPVAFVNLVVEESVVCLKYVNNNSLILTESSRDENDVPFLHSVLGGRINVFYFKENRVRILEVAKIMMETCLRAFDDIRFVNGGFGRIGAQSAIPLHVVPREGNVIVGESIMHGLYNSYQTLDMLGNVILQEYVGSSIENHHRVAEVEPDKRTIFLTFSKGYPTLESEVKEYFTRRYGDIVEAVHMQEVLPEKQSLYARLVVRRADIISVVLEDATKAKFTINGKQVWARRFIKKHNLSN